MTPRALPFRFVALDAGRLVLASNAAALAAVSRPAVDQAPWTTEMAWRFCRRHAGGPPHLLLTSDPRVTLPSWCSPPTAGMLLAVLGPGASFDDLGRLGELGRHLFPGVTGLWRTPTGIRWIAYEPFPLASLVPDPAVLPFLLQMPSVRHNLGVPSGLPTWLPGF